MNFHAIKAIYRFEMARTFRTMLESILSPVLSTSLYFIVFGAAIGSLKRTASRALIGTSVVASRGPISTTCGAVWSGVAPVVKEKFEPVRRLPAMSSIPWLLKNTLWLRLTTKETLGTKRTKRPSGLTE